MISSYSKKTFFQTLSLFFRLFPAFMTFSRIQDSARTLVLVTGWSQVARRHRRERNVSFTDVPCHDTRQIVDEYCVECIGGFAIQMIRTFPGSHWGRPMERENFKQVREWSTRIKTKTSSPYCRFSLSRHQNINRKPFNEWSQEVYTL